MIDRIGDRATFATFARGRHAHCGPVRVRFVAGPAQTRPTARVAYAINRRTGNAVLRNRIRRRLRAALCVLDCHGEGPLPSGAYLFSAEASVATLPFEELTSLVRCVVRRAASPGVGDVGV